MSVSTEENHSIIRKDGSGQLRVGLGRTIFSWFLLLSLLPLITVGALEYQSARDNIVENRHDELSTVNLMLSRQIGDYFDDIVVNMHFRSGQAVEFLQALKELRSSYSSVSEMLASNEYYETADEYGIEFIDLMRFYDYSDVVLGDAEGNILYTVGRYSDFGENLFTGRLSNTVFSQTVREAMDNDDRIYSDQEIYPPAGDEKISFFVLPLVDDREKTVGFLAAQIWARDDISFILNQSLGLSDYVHAYVVGQDKSVRFYPEQAVFSEDPLELDPVNEWLGHFADDGSYIMEQHLTDHEDEAHGSHDERGNLFADEEGGVDNLDSHVMVYLDKDGRKVIGVSRNIEIAGSNMLVLSEMGYEEAMAPAVRFRNQLILVLGVTSFLVLVIAGLITRRIVNPIRTITRWVNEVASGNYIDGQVVSQKNEIGELSRSFQTMTERLRKVSADNEMRSWHQSGVAQLNETVRGEQAMAELCRSIITTLCRYLDIPMGAMYVLADGRRLQMMGSFSLSMRKKMGSAFVLGEGLPGQAALEKQPITILVPEDYFAIESGLGCRQPDRVFVMPVIYEGEVRAVLEFALLDELTGRKKDFLEAAIESIAIAINSSQARERVQELLDKTTHQAQTLQQQQEDLRTANEELEHQTKVLKESEEELKTQSDELQRANVELEEKSESLFHQKEEIELKNQEIEIARTAIEKKAEELEQVSRYKSEFLANMSHELRTPLNSMLILARMLADNEEENLDDDQVESAQVIHKVGHDLLDLINDILDLSKVEAGKMEVNLEAVPLQSMLEQIKNQFSPLAKDRQLTFEIVSGTDVNVDIETDGQRVMQILKNLLSNAFKFTEQGGVKLHICKMAPSADFSAEQLRQHGAISLAVEDSGIGIPKEKQDAIFSAFQQADGSTSRKYGGTGLGLSIAREMAVLLGGEMRLASEAGKGSTFSLLLPAKLQASSLETTTEFESAARTHSPAQLKETVPAESAEDDRDQLSGSRPVLVVEDDPQFSRVLYRLAKNQGCTCIVASTGQEAMTLASKYKPQAVILDLGLPDMDGRDVLLAIKQQPETAETPVHIISGRDNDGSLLTLGASDYLTKPVSNEQLEKMFNGFEADGAAQVLVIDPDVETSEQVQKVLAGRRGVLQATTAGEARKMLAENVVSNIIIELNLPDESGDVLLESLKSQYGDKLPPVIINTAEAIDRERYKSLGSLSGTMVVKGEDSSTERLQDEVGLFLNSVAKPTAKRKKPAAKPQGGDAQLKGRKILLVDDDLRNTFALSKALQKYEMDIVLADNGELALEQLEKEAGSVELVLMDIMMPVMNGYEAMEAMRKQERYRDLPVIALTAKAMADDRDKCIQAGASDYLTKPVDVEKLVAMLRVWLQG